MNRTAVMFVVVSTLLLTHGTASAYRYHGCNGQVLKRNNPAFGFNADSISFPPGSIWMTSLNAALQRWNEIPSTLNLRAASTRHVNLDIRDDETETWFSSHQGFFPAPVDGELAQAITYHKTNCDSGGARIVAADIIFNSLSPFTTSMSQSQLKVYQGANNAFELTAIHEIGHAVGIAHVPDTYSIMAGFQQHIHMEGTAGRSYVGADTARAAIASYGLTNANIEDVSVSHWQHDWNMPPSAAGSAIHSRAWASQFGPDIQPDDLLGTDFNHPDKPWLVSLGQQYYFNFTYENNGKSFQRGVALATYISTNKTISTADTPVTNTAFSALDINTLFAYPIRITIPNGLARGRVYYVGVIIDPNNAIAEIDETPDSNRAYVPIKIL